MIKIASDIIIVIKKYKLEALKSFSIYIDGNRFKEYIGVGLSFRSR